MNHKEKYSKKKNIPKKKKSFNELAEQFTIQGFIMVSGLALMLSIGFFPAFGIYSELGWTQIYGWKIIFYHYGFCWIFCFLFMCLIPKLQGRK